MDKRHFLYIIVALFITAYSANGFSKLEGIGADKNAKLIQQTSGDNISIEPNQWLEKIEVSDYTPHAGDEITIKGYGWYPTGSNDYENTVEIVLRVGSSGTGSGTDTTTSGAVTDIFVGRIMPDENGYFEAEIRLPDALRYNDLVYIQCNGFDRAVLYIRD